VGHPSLASRVAALAIAAVVGGTDPAPAQTPQRPDAGMAMPVPLYVIAKFKAKAGQQDAVMQTLTDMVAPTRLEPGNIAYDLFQSAVDPTEFYFVEAWQSKAALNEHFGKPYFAVMDQKLSQQLYEHYTVTMVGMKAPPSPRK